MLAHHAQAVQLGLVHIHQVHIGQAHGLKALNKGGESADRVVLLHTVIRIAWGNAHAHAARTDGVCHGLQHHQRQARAVFGAAAVFVCALVAVGVEELVDKVATGAMQLHAVYAGGAGVARGLGIFSRDARHFISAQSAGHGARQGLTVGASYGIGARDG